MDARFFQMAVTVFLVLKSGQLWHSSGVGQQIWSEGEVQVDVERAAAVVAGAAAATAAPSGVGLVRAAARGARLQDG